MYKLQLIAKYLVKRRIAWVALVAVMLCTAMVLIVTSVMGGWLVMFQESFHAETGDVIVSANSVTGFPYYGEMIADIVKIPGVVAAVPVIRTAAIININQQDVNFVQVTGYTPDIQSVIPWSQTLHRQHDAKAINFGLLPDVPYEFYVNRKAGNPLNRAGIIVSGPLVGLTHEKSEEFQKSIRQSMLRFPVTLTMLPIAAGEAVDVNKAVVEPCWIIDDSKSRVWQMDNSTVYMSFDVLQNDLHMGEVRDDQGQLVTPARCSEITVKTVAGADLDVIREQIAAVTRRVQQKHQVEPYYGTSVNPWTRMPNSYISAVQTEITLMTVLFGVISSVAVLLIFCIFYMIVLEKTKDIGILKSVGASSVGILSLFLGYGLAIGLVGAGLGSTLAFFVCKYINQINTAVGRMTKNGKAPFNAETYQFDTLPNTMDPHTVAVVVVVAVLSALIGALLPALRAATMNPVDALRYE
jgi:lipoprotein-releasing system permease protein